MKRPLCGMPPAHQGLRPHHVAGEDIALGLGVEGEFSPLQGAGDLGEQMELLLQNILHLRVVADDVLTGGGMAQGQGGPVIVDLRRQLQVVNGADAKGREHPEDAALAEAALQDILPQHFHQLHPPGHQDGEIVPFKVAGHPAVFPADGLQTPRHMAQEMVALIPPIEPVEHSEVQDVHSCQAVGVGSGLENKFPCIFHKSARKKEAREQIFSQGLLVRFGTILGSFHIQSPNPSPKRSSHCRTSFNQNTTFSRICQSVFWCYCTSVAKMPENSTNCPLKSFWKTEPSPPSFMEAEDGFMALSGGKTQEFSPMESRTVTVTVCS